MAEHPLTISDIRELIKKGDVQDPIAFLEAVMSGQDPRGFSTLYDMAYDMQEFSEGEPTVEEWAELWEHIQAACKYRQVTLTESLGASKTLAEYLHPKRKQIDIYSASGSTGSIADSPLTEEEIELFKERFNDEF